ncbi:hypothetical protein L7F22_038447 [Adiantum nelumboides]|nr:hypothetical protein [Adiantum nelumboides]
MALDTAYELHPERVDEIRRMVSAYEDELNAFLASLSCDPRSKQFLGESFEQFLVPSAQNLVTFINSAVAGQARSEILAPLVSKRIKDLDGTSMELMALMKQRMWVMYGHEVKDDTFKVDLVGAIDWNKKSATSREGNLKFVTRSTPSRDEWEEELRLKTA